MEDSRPQNRQIFQSLIERIEGQQRQVYTEYSECHNLSHYTLPILLVIGPGTNDSFYFMQAFRPGKTFNLMEADFTEAIRQKLGASHSQFLELRRHIGEDVPETLGNDDDDAKKVGFSTMREHDVCHFMHVYFEA